MTRYPTNYDRCVVAKEMLNFIMVQPFCTDLACDVRAIKANTSIHQSK